MQIESAELHGKDLTEPEYYSTSEKPVILTVIQVESYEDEEVMIEYTLANPIPFKDVVECVVNDVKVHLTK